MARLAEFWLVSAGLRTLNPSNRLLSFVMPAYKNIPVEKSSIFPSTCEQYSIREWVISHLLTSTGTLLLCKRIAAFLALILTT